jgi:adenosine kinase
LNIVITGSVAFDYIMSFPGYFKDHILPDRLESISLSFLVDSMVRRRGGTAPNIAYTMALLGGRPRLLATVGEDFLEYRQWLESKGVDSSTVRVIPGEFTASFFANTDQSNAQIASFYPGAMAYAAELSLRELAAERIDLVVISPNDPQAMKRYVSECREMKIPYIYDPSQQIPRLSSDELRCGVEGSLALFLNDYEFSLVQKHTNMDSEEILEKVEFVVVTRGEHGSTVHTRTGRFYIPVVTPDHIADPTGVGDAYRGGFLIGYERGLDLETCGRLGALAATYCLEQQGPQGHDYTPADFLARFRRHFDDRGLLEGLLFER